MQSIKFNDLPIKLNCAFTENFVYIHEIKLQKLHFFSYVYVVMLCLQEK